MKRRDFLKIGGGLFLVQTIQGRHGRYKKMVMGGGPIPGGTLDPRTVAKFQSSFQIACVHGRPSGYSHASGVVDGNRFGHGPEGESRPLFPCRQVFP